MNHPVLVPGVNTHENVIFSCYGGFFNTGITSALACLDVVKELGLRKVAIGCLAGLPLQLEGVVGKTKAANEVITVDGCPNQCAFKMAEQAGVNVTKSIILSLDIGLKKLPLHEVLGSSGRMVMDYIEPEKVKETKEPILWKKGTSVRNIFIYLGAFSSMKIPMLGIVIGYLGVEFTLARTLISLPLFIAIGLLMEKYLEGKDFKVINQGEVIPAGVKVTTKRGYENA
ncbi:MAG: putative zinc-binding protein [Dehalogenimonas sp.]